MLKPIVDFVKTITASYGRLTKAEENIKKILTHSDEQGDTVEASKDMLMAILHEMDKDKAVAAEQRRTV